MIPLEGEQSFRGSREKFWQVIFHPKYPEALKQLVGVKQMELLELTDHGDRIVRVVRSEPERDLPAAVRKITGASLVYTETATLYKAEHRHEFKVVLDKMPNRADIAGRFVLTEPEPGKLIRRCQGQITINIPLLGKKVEKSIVKDMSESMERTAQVIQEWLDNPLPPRE